MVSLRLVVLLACFAGGCGGRGVARTVIDGGRDVVSTHDAQTPVPLRPRWIGMGDKFGLSVVRFDDATAPETTILAWLDLPTRTPPASQPAVVLPAKVEDDAEVLAETTSWSVEGRHLVFATREAKAIRLWVASAENRFVPREIVPGNADQLVARWISDETMVVAVVHDDQVDFVRASAPAWSVEKLGSYLGSAEAHAAANATFTASRAGALFSLGSPASGELWLVRGNEAPSRVGAAIRKGMPGCRYDLSWSLDGQSAVWWGRTLFDSLKPSDRGCQDPPPVDAVPGASPSLGIEALSTRITRQDVSDPGNSRYGAVTYYWGSISWVVAGAPTGSAIAYGRCPFCWTTRSLPDDKAWLGTLVVKSAGEGPEAPARREETEASVCASGNPLFGFINATDYFFARRRTLIDGGLANFEFIINRQGQEHVVHDHLSGVSDPGVFARGHHLFFVGVDESGRGVWSVDLTAPTPRAERVAFDVANNEGLDRLRPTGTIPRLRPSEWLGGVDQSDEPMRDSPDREALLVGIRESSLIPCDAYLCSRWLVVNFENEPAVVPLDSAWRKWDLTWTPDGQGLLAVGEGVVWLTGPGYQDRYRLAEENRGLFVPPRWPAP